MNATMRNVSNRLSLRAPQWELLEALVKSIQVTKGEMLASGGVGRMHWKMLEFV